MHTEQTPKEQGYYFPPEWHPHSATWLAWPHNKDTWFERTGEAQAVYCRFIEQVVRSETVHLMVNDAAMEQDVRRQLDTLNIAPEGIVFHHFPTNDAWCRDYGGGFLLHKNSDRKMLLNWGFNSWGDKYPPYDADNAVPLKMGAYLNVPVVTPGMILEGGSVEFNGAGTVLTTRSCLLNKNRNPHLSAREIEQALADCYGMEQVLWLEDGIEGDDTDGHIDDLTRFISEDTVVTVMEDSKQSPNYETLKRNAEALGKMQLMSGKSLQVIELPMPSPVYYKNDLLPASYANFYACNSAVIVPVFRDKNDDRALDIIQKCFPDKQVVGLDSRDIVIGLGSFHCLSQQEPEVVKAGSGRGVK